MVGCGGKEPFAVREERPQLIGGPPVWKRGGQKKKIGETGPGGSVVITCWNGECQKESRSTLQIDKECVHLSKGAFAKDCKTGESPHLQLGAVLGPWPLYLRYHDCKHHWRIVFGTYRVCEVALRVII